MSTGERLRRLIVISKHKVHESEWKSALRPWSETMTSENRNNRNRRAHRWNIYLRRHPCNYIFVLKLCLLPQAFWQRCTPCLSLKTLGVYCRLDRWIWNLLEIIRSYRKKHAGHFWPAWRMNVVSGPCNASIPLHSYSSTRLALTWFRSLSTSRITTAAAQMSGCCWQAVVGLILMSDASEGNH